MSENIWCVLGHFQLLWASISLRENLVFESWKMSFFSSLVANVSSGVANLGLNRRFSLSRQDSGEANSHDAANLKAATTPSITVTSSSNLSTQHGECLFSVISRRKQFFLRDLYDFFFVSALYGRNLINQFWENFWEIAFFLPQTSFLFEFHFE